MTKAIASKTTTSLMRQEAAEAPEAIARQLQANQSAVQDLAGALRAIGPDTLLTLARGSSDHAASFVAYVGMVMCGRPITSVPSSLVNLHQAPVPTPQTLALAFSQSGQSPDLVGALQRFRQAGSPTIAWVNDAQSPLAKAAHWAIDLHAGPEKSVAATKTYLAQLVGGLHWLSLWQRDGALLNALQALPQAMHSAIGTEWPRVIDALRTADRLFVLGRGSALPLAQEAALKFKETCGLHAEAFSSAEVLHGPQALIRKGFVVLALAPRGLAQASTLATAQQLRERGATVLVAAPDGLGELTLVKGPHEVLDALTAMQSFYMMVEQLSRERGHNPDAPEHLSKVTLTT